VLLSPLVIYVETLFFLSFFFHLDCLSVQSIFLFFYVYLLDKLSHIFLSRWSQGRDQTQCRSAFFFKSFLSPFEGKTF
jgi:hypothetical protein